MKPSMTKNGANHRVFERPNPAHLVRSAFNLSTPPGRAEARSLVEAAKKRGLIKAAEPKPANYREGRPKIHNEITVKYRENPTEYHRQRRAIVGR